jgi:hypothetical protein
LKILTIALFVLVFAFNIYSQDDSVEFVTGSYKITAQFDTANYCSKFVISSGSKTIVNDCVDRVESIRELDVEGKGEKTLLITFFTGGAHCCFYITAATLKNDIYTVKDTLYLGDAGCEIHDKDNDGKVEFESVDTRFGYAFTNFAQSRFPIIIFQFRNGKFVEVTKRFPELVETDIKVLKKELNDEFLKKGFDCPSSKDEDTFNTDAGAVKAILAPIVQDYFYLGKIEEGLDYVGKVYKCKDVNKFINILKEDYKLK